MSNLLFSSTLFGVHSVGTVAPARLVPSGAQWHVEACGNACHSAPALRNSVGTIAHAEQAPRGAWRHAGMSSSVCT